MKITVMGVLVVIGSALLVVLVTYAIAQALNNTPKTAINNVEPNPTT